MEKKKTLVLGASMNPERYSFKAINNLRRKGYEVVAVGRRNGRVNDVDITKEKEMFPEVDTVTMYLNANNQKEYYDYLINLRPKRIIFNPGAENKELDQMAKEHGIQTKNACTLVMLNTGQY